MVSAIRIEVAPGELIDKLTILEIKRERIQDPAKLANVEIEFAALQSAFEGAVAASDALPFCARTARGERAPLGHRG